MTAVKPRRGPGHKHHYAPPVDLREVPGVKKRSDRCQDQYSGTKEQLIAMGLAPDGMFPGDPGMPLSSATLWPIGTLYGSSWFTPGRLQLVRAPSGRFCASLVVSESEQVRRAAHEEDAHARRNAEYEAEEQLRRAERLACASLDSIVTTLGADRVLARVEVLRRKGKPRRSCEHLRLVWSATERRS